MNVQQLLLLRTLQKYIHRQILKPLNLPILMHPSPHPLPPQLQHYPHPLLGEFYLQFAPLKCLLRCLLPQCFGLLLGGFKDDATMWENVSEERKTGDDGDQCEFTNLVILSKTENCSGEREVYEVELVDVDEGLC